jgi:hypothetical protein
LIGKVKRFFPKISVVVLEPKETLRVGDTVRITGEESPNSRKAKIDFVQIVESMQLNHKQIDEANPGDGKIGLKVCQKVREGCKVFKI